MKKDEIPRNQIVIRADANIRMGTGHLMRCLALAQAWRDDGGGVTFLTATDLSMLQDRLQSEGMAVNHLSTRAGSYDDAMQTAAFARKIYASWIVIDGYQFDGAYQKALKDSGRSVLFIDDFGHAGHYYADIVLNQNIYAVPTLYPNKEVYTHFLLGPRYALLRREFLKWRGWKRESLSIARKVLVTMGGSDQKNVSGKVIRAIQHLKKEDLEVAVVVGSNNPHYEDLKSIVGNSPLPIRLIRNVANMSELMAWADVGIAGGGSTYLELAFLGLPFLVVNMADNQRLSTEQLNAVGAATNLGWHEDLSIDEIEQSLTKLMGDREKRSQMVRHNQQLVDGNGAVKVLMHMKSDSLELKKACEKDCRLLWVWANDEDARSASFRSEIIPWEEHVNWFKSKLHDSNCIIYIANDAEREPIGQVRLDVDGEKAVISVSIDRKFRKKRYGSLLILKASKKMFDDSDVETINAYIKQSNEPSVRAFLKAGFQDKGTKLINGYNAICLALEKDGMV